MPVTLREQIKSELTAAMRSGDVLRRDTLRLAENALYGAEKVQARPLTDEQALAILTREVKTHRESIEGFEKGGRTEAVARERAQIEILAAFLPQQLGEPELQSLVDEAIAATGAASARDLGRVMGWLSPRTKGRADGRHVAELVAQALARRELAAHDAAAARTTGSRT